MTNQVDREEVEWVENRARELCTGNERNKVETITAVRNVMINAYRDTAAAIWSQWPERSRGQGLSAVWVVYGDDDIDPFRAGREAAESAGRTRLAEMRAGGMIESERAG